MNAMRCGRCGGIIGIFGKKNAKEIALDALRRMSPENAMFLIISDDSDATFSDLDSCEIEECENIMACCMCGDFERLRRLFEMCGVNRVVADAEIFNIENLENMLKANSYELTALINVLDGAYAIAFWKDNGEVCVLRDVFGLKPLYFAHFNGCFAFSSCREIIEMNFPHAFEVEPRTRLIFSGGRLRFESQSLMDSLSEAMKWQEVIQERRESENHSKIRHSQRSTDCEELRSELLSLLCESISLRIPDERFGILFSGGLDSSLIAFLCKQMWSHRHGDGDAAVTCYTAVFSGAKEAYDLIYSREIANEIGIRHVVTEIGTEEVERYLREIVPVVGADVVNVGVALPLFIACESARSEGISTLFYGIGAEELFGGYERHRRAAERGRLRDECISGVEKMFRRDLLRDAAISRNLCISLRAPFMTKKIAYFALNLPDEMKIRKNLDKAILRDVAWHLGLKRAASRKKRAAQYGSNFHKALKKLSKKNHMRIREYLRSFHPHAKMKLGCLFSGGKDSTLALHAMVESGYIVDCLITVRCINPSAMIFHTAAIELTELLADAMEIPLITRRSTCESEEEEISALREALSDAISQFGIEGVVAGALWSEYQRSRIVRICEEMGLKCFFPLWHIDQETEMRICVRAFDMIFTSIAALGLDRSWLGRKICDNDVNRLFEIHKKYGINITGEGGEFETLVLDAPLFRKRVSIKGEIDEIDANTARFVVKKAELMDK